eukprot:456541-Rhodomonas_salina.2
MPLDKCLLEKRLRGSEGGALEGLVPFCLGPLPTKSECTVYGYKICMFPMHPFAVSDSLTQIFFTLVAADAVSGFACHDALRCAMLQSLCFLLSCRVLSSSPPSPFSSARTHSSCSTRMTWPPQLQRPMDCAINLNPLGPGRRRHWQCHPCV